METVLSYIWTLLGDTLQAVWGAVIHNIWILLFGALVAVFIKTYVDTEKMSQILLKRQRVSIVASVAIGAFTPFCACGTTAVIVGMLTTTLPWGPIMAFLTSSPLMSPSGFVLMAGVISLRFAIALTAASLVIGISTGFITSWIEKKTKLLHDQTRFSGKKPESTCGCSSAKAENTCGCLAAEKEPACSCGGEAVLAAKEFEGASCGCTPALDPVQMLVGQDGTISASTFRDPRPQWKTFAQKAKLKELGTGFVQLGLRQILLNFAIFIGVGYFINRFIPSSIISALLGANNIFAVPLASVIGLPLYVTTDSAIPIIQSMISSGASEGAMLSFVIAGSATSAWVIAGLSTFLKKRAIALYVGFVLAGGIVCGYLYDLVLMIAK